MSGRKRVGILISGRGSNMAALIAASHDTGYPAEIVTVISNRPKAPGLVTAASQGIAAVALDHKAFPTREAFEAEMDKALRGAQVEIIACAGFMRIMTAGFIEEWRNRMINIHPSLLPNYRGLHTHERALADGVRIHGCTVHLVRPEIDAGPIIAQAAVPVVEGDTPETLSGRVLEAEHILYPLALRRLAGGMLRIEGERVIHLGEETAGPPLFSPSQ